MKMNGENPREFKVNLAKLVITDFHSAVAATEAEDEFNRRFVKKEIPDEIEEATVATGTWKLSRLLVETNLAASMAEAKRLIEQGGVKTENEKISDVAAEIEISAERNVLIQVGKRKFLRVRAN